MVQNRTPTAMKDPKTSHLLETLLKCASECWSCASDCLNEPHVQHMTDCIQADLDCADFCLTTARSVARGSQHVEQLLQQCAAFCKACEAICRTHPEEHCQHCADICLGCMDACLKYPQVVTLEPSSTPDLMPSPASAS